MSNFYREFTKDLQRRFNSRAFDLKPQEVVDNRVQLIADVERPFIRKMVFGMSQGLTHVPTVQTDWNYGQTIVALNPTTLTPLGWAGSPGQPNPPLLVASTDDIARVTIDQFKYQVSLFNGGAIPTAQTHNITFYIQDHGSTVGSTNHTFQQSNSGIIAPAGSLAMRNNLAPYTTNNVGNISNRFIPIVFDTERIIGSTIPQDPANVANQLTWGFRHNWSGAETETLSVGIHVEIHCTIEYRTPFNQIFLNRPITLQP